MARIIEFRPVTQANFSDSNQALALSYDQYDKAIKQANNVADYFNQAVNNRNEAEIQGYINSIPQDEWYARQGEIDAKIAQIAKQSGNQFDPKVINTYRDLRYPTLLERDTKEMAHTTAQQAFGAEQLAWANRAKEYAKTPEEIAEIEAVFDKYSSPQIQAQAQAVQDTLATEILNNQTNKLQAEQGLVKAGLFDELPAFESAVQKLTRQSAILGITPQEHKDYERIKNQVAQFQNQVNSYLNNPKYTPTQTAIFQNVLNQKYPEVFEMINEMNKARQAQANKDRDYELDKFKAQNTANYQQGQLEIGRQNADTKQIETFLAGNKGSQGKKSEKESDNPATNYLNKTFGQDWQHDGKLNGTLLNSQIKNKMNQLTRDEALQFLPEFNISETDYIKWRNENLPKIKDIHSKKYLGTSVGFNGFINAVEEYRHNGRPLNNWEKIQLLNRVPYINLKFNEKDQISAFMVELDAQRHAVREELKNQFIRDTVTNLEQLGYSHEQIAQATGWHANSNFYQNNKQYLPKEMVAYIESSAPKSKEKLFGITRYSPMVADIVNKYTKSINPESRLLPSQKGKITYNPKQGTAIKKEPKKIDNPKKLGERNIPR